MIRRALILGTALTAILLMSGLAQRRISISWEGGSVSFGGLRLSGGHVEPCQRRSRVEDETWNNAAGQQVPVQAQQQPSPEALRGRELSDKGAQAFAEGRWAEAADYLRQALALLPGDPAIAKTLMSAQVGLDMEESAKRADEAKLTRAAEDSERVAGAIDRLTEALDSLRHEACRSLIDRGDFEAAVRLPQRTDFVIDSSVVDLRHVRQGVVDFDAVKPPPSRTGAIGFSQPARPAEATPVQRVRTLLDSPAVEAVIFNERMGEAAGFKAPDEGRQDRAADPVKRAVADYLGVDLGRASAAERTLVEQKTRAMWEVYDQRMKERSSTKMGINGQSLKTFNAMMDRLKSQGLIKPGENLLEKEKNDPWFRDLVKSETRAIVLEEEAGRREADRKSFDKMLADVAGVLGRKGQ